MANYTAVMETQQALEQKIMKKFTEFESQMKTSAPGNSTLKRLQEEITDFKTCVWSILDLLRQQISELTRNVEASEMRHRRKYLLISGVSEDIKDNLPEYIAQLFKDKLGLCNMASGKFKACYRLGVVKEGKSRPILIQFADVSDKSSVWKKKTALKGTSLVLSEFLTRNRQALFIKARQQFGMRSCWTADGVIMVKLADGTRHRIVSEDDFKAIPSPAEDDSSDHTRSRSASPVPTVHSDQHSNSKRAARCKK